MNILKLRALLCTIVDSKSEFEEYLFVSVTHLFHFLFDLFLCVPELFCLNFVVGFVLKMSIIFNSYVFIWFVFSYRGGQLCGVWVAIRNKITVFYDPRWSLKMAKIQYSPCFLTLYDIVLAFDFLINYLFSPPSTVLYLPTYNETKSTKTRLSPPSPPHKISNYG